MDNYPQNPVKPKVFGLNVCNFYEWAKQAGCQGDYAHHWTQALYCTEYCIFVYNLSLMYVFKYKQKWYARQQIK